MNNKDILIIGAGLSGLACALTLNKQRISCTILESSDAVGGRVQTHTTTDGFIIDEGFQVILNSYPELSKFVDVTTLNLKKFNSGAMVFNGKNLELLANPVVHPENLWPTAMNQSITLSDKALVVKLIFSSQLQRTDFPTGNKSTESFLKDFGFSENFIEFFWRPFLTGVYLDPDLKMGENFFKFLMRCFSLGKVSVPSMGMRELPLQMAKQLPTNTIFLNHPVSSWGADHVMLVSGERLNAKKVICAFDPTTTPYHSVMTYYFTGEKLKETIWDKWLVLIPRKLGMTIDHLCLLSEVSESYGAGKPLLSVSVVGNKNSDIKEVLREIDLIAGQTLNLRHVTTTVVKKALPQTASDTMGFTVIDGVVYCGDRWASPSINGALASGRLAAEFVLNEKKN